VQSQAQPAGRETPAASRIIDMKYSVKPEAARTPSILLKADPASTPENVNGSGERSGSYQVVITLDALLRMQPQMLQRTSLASPPEVVPDEDTLMTTDGEREIGNRFALMTFAAGGVSMLALRLLRARQAALVAELIDTSEKPNGPMRRPE
jgi:hypothetical protein